MVSRFVLVIGALLIQFCMALIPNVNIPDTENTDHSEPGHLSLPNLLKIDSLSDLELTWETLPNIKLDTGRLLIQKGPGGIWSLPTLANTANEWTIELIFRSSGSSKNDLAYSAQNGLAFWMIDPVSTTINRDNMENFGGPQAFDGFQFLMNNKDMKGLKVFANDGSRILQNTIEDAIGKCNFNYLDSQVPFSVRISYSKLRKWFKVQVDNYLCFKTDKIVIPETMNDFRFGVTGNVHPSSSEELEILRLSVWNHLTDDALDDHGLMSDGSVKVDLKTVTQGEDQFTFKPRQSLMEKSRMQREAILNDQIKAAGTPGTNNKDHSELYSKIDQLDQLYNFMESRDNKFDFVKMEEKIFHIEEDQLKQLSDLHQDFTEFKQIVVEQYSEIVQAIGKLNEKIIGEVREQQYTIDELGRKVELLMQNHKEVAYQYENRNETPSNELPGLLSAIIKWVLIPVIILILILTVFVYRLRHDIKHSKLL